MNNIILSPPIAFLAYLVLVGILNMVGRFLAGPTKTTALKTSTYASGEAPPTTPAVPGYRPFFVVALFFAILHLGVLVLGTSGFAGVPGIYLVGLLIVLVALMLG